MSESQAISRPTAEQTEIWQRVTIEPYCTTYSVSSLGRIRRDGRAPGTTAGMILKPKIETNGYHRITLQCSGIRRTFLLHHVVSLAFHGEPLGRCGKGRDDYQIDHIDGDKANNAAINLRWVTMLRNMRLASEAGLLAFGDRNATRRYPERLHRGDDHHARLRPERLARGDRNGARVHIERMARGSRNGAHTKPWRRRRGETHGMAKLSADDIRVVRELFLTGSSLSVVARRFGISKTHASRIKHGKNWLHFR